MNTYLSPRRFCLTAPTCIAVALASASVAFAQSSVDRNRPRVAPGEEVRVVETRRLDKSDRAFFDKVAKTSMSEIAISRVAASRTSNPEVRRFAQMMIEDHERATEELADLASVRGISLPAKDPQPTRWEKRDAKNFDREYIGQMIEDHEDMVELLQKHAKDGKDRDAVAFARKHLPKMQTHLQHALDLKKALENGR